MADVGVLRQQPSDIFEVLLACPKMLVMCFHSRFLLQPKQFFITAHFDKLVGATPFPSYL